MLKIILLKIIIYIEIDFFKCQNVVVGIGFGANITLIPGH